MHELYESMQTENTCLPFVQGKTEMKEKNVKTALSLWILLWLFLDKP